MDTRKTRKSVPARGKRSPWIKRVMLCLELLFTDEPQTNLAKKYGITEGMICRYRQSLGISRADRNRYAATPRTSRTKKAKFEL